MMYFKRLKIIIVFLILIIFALLLFLYKETQKSKINKNQNLFFSKKGEPFYQKQNIVENTPNVKLFDLSSKLDPSEIYMNIQCRKSKEIFVSTTLCVHDINNDRYVSGSIWINGVWENHVICLFNIFVSIK